MILVFNRDLTGFNRFSTGVFESLSVVFCMPRFKMILRLPSSGILGERLRDRVGYSRLNAQTFGRMKLSIRPRVFGPIFGPLRPTAGPWSLGTDSGSKNIAGCAKSQPRRPIIRPVRGYFVNFWCGPEKDKKINDKSEAPQGEDVPYWRLYLS